MIWNYLYVMGLVWVLLVLIDIAYRGHKWSRGLQRLGQILLSTYPRTLAVYEILYATTIVLVFLFMTETMGPLSPYPLSVAYLWTNAVFMSFGGFIGMYYAASMRADKAGTYRTVVRKALRETDLPEETIRNIINLHRQDPLDETNAWTYRALIELSDEPTTLGNMIQKILGESATNQ